MEMTNQEKDSFESLYLHKDYPAMLNRCISETEEGHLYILLDYWNKLKTESAKLWVQQNEQLFNGEPNDPDLNIFKHRLWRKVYYILYQNYLQINLGQHGKIVEDSPKRLVIRWTNSPCPIAASIDLPTQHICRGAFHEPYEVILKKINTKLWFNRVYDANHLRPVGRSCIEIITFGDLTARIHDDFGQPAHEDEDYNRVTIPLTKKSLPPRGCIGENPILFRPLNQEDWTEFPKRVFDVVLPIWSFAIRFTEGPQDELETLFFLWCEHIDRWVTISLREDLDGPECPLEDGYAQHILDCFGIHPSVMSQEQAIKTHPLRLKYLAKIRNRGSLISDIRL